jgi:hypothetical protein
MARDVFLQIICELLERQGWVITHDPLHFFIGQNDVTDILGIELIAAEQSEQKIAFFLEPFFGTSKITDFYTALGRFTHCRSLLSRQLPERKLFLAIPKNVFEDFFQTELVQIARQDLKVDILVFMAEKEVIQWEYVVQI